MAWLCPIMQGSTTQLCDFMNLSNKQNYAMLALGALGVVYGDIGTSPLYTLNTIFTAGVHPPALNPENILGILSLIFWSLMIVVSFKYVAFIMQADNRGEGGIIALLALALSKMPEQGRTSSAILAMGLFGAALFYGDGVITPAISVISAVEGLQVASPVFKEMVVPITLVILVPLFLFQRKGTARVGALFGPLMMLWFAVLALLGVKGILIEPSILFALNPMHGVRFFTAAPLIGFLSLGGVVLALTGAEALYADMGHFGKKPIRLAWFCLVLPALLLNYFGQGALLIQNPKAIENPFYMLAPEWALYPMVILATVATIIASQAVISGAFSMTDQAIKLGYAPRMTELHTSEAEIGQIYVPGINLILMVAVIALVLGFKTSANLATAYGIAVSGTMLLTTIIAFFVVRRLWGWGRLKGGLLIATLMVVDVSFFSANAIKVEEGGWLPLGLGCTIFLLMTTWKQGRTMVAERMKREAIALKSFVSMLSSGSITRVPGTAVFLTTNPDGVPSALMHNMKHNKVIHEQVIILAVRVLEIPHVTESEHLEYEDLGHQFHCMILRFGFMDDPNVPLVLSQQKYLPLEPMDTSYFLSRETLIPQKGSEMPLWRQKLFVTMFRNSGSAVAFFKIPPNRVVEIGAQITL